MLPDEGGALALGVQAELQASRTTEQRTCRSTAQNAPDMNTTENSKTHSKDLAKPPGYNRPEARPPAGYVAAFQE